MNLCPCAYICKHGSWNFPVKSKALIKIHFKWNTTFSTSQLINPLELMWLVSFLRVWGEGYHEWRWYRRVYWLSISSPSQYSYTIWGGQVDMPQEDSRNLQQLQFWEKIRYLEFPAACLGAALWMPGTWPLLGEVTHMAAWGIKGSFKPKLQAKLKNVSCYRCFIEASLHVNMAHSSLLF